MKRANIISTVIILLFSSLFTIEAMKMPMSDGLSPGAGFIPFGVGLLMVILSCFLLAQSIWMDSKKANVVFMEKREGIKDILYITGSFAAYCIFVTLVGFPISTFLFMLFFLKAVGKYRFKFNVMISIITCLLLWLVFQYWLEMPLPAGMADIF